MKTGRTLFARVHLWPSLFTRGAPANCSATYQTMNSFSIFKVLRLQLGNISSTFLLFFFPLLLPFSPHLSIDATETNEKHKYTIGITNRLLLPALPLSSPPRSPSRLPPRRLARVSVPPRLKLSVCSLCRKRNTKRKIIA